jgi:hypothetical protein
MEAGMKKWLSGVRGVVGMALLWAAGWFFVGMMIEITEPDPDFIDVWPTALAIPGLVGGLIFSAVLRIAEGRRRFEEPSFPRFAAWGAVTGLLLGVLVVSVLWADEGFTGLWPWAVALLGFTTVLSAVSAAGIGLLFRYAVREGALAGAGAKG